jgi:hypothetical protein
LIVALTASFKLAAAASVASAALISEFWEFWAGISEFAADGGGPDFTDRVLSFFRFDMPNPKSKSQVRKHWLRPVLLWPLWTSSTCPCTSFVDLFLPQRRPHSASLVTWKAFACTILPTIRLLSLMIRLVRLVAALESLLKWIMNNRGESVDENVLIFDYFARRKRKLIFTFHFLTIEDPQIKDVCLGPSTISKPLNPNPRSIFEIA